VAYFCLPVDVKPQELTTLYQFIAGQSLAQQLHATTMCRSGLGKAFPCKAEK